MKLRLALTRPRAQALNDPGRKHRSPHDIRWGIRRVPIHEHTISDLGAVLQHHLAGCVPAGATRTAKKPAARPRSPSGGRGRAPAPGAVDSRARRQPSHHFRPGCPSGSRSVARRRSVKALSMRGHFPRPSDVLVGHARKNRLGDTPGRPLILKKFGRYSQRPIGGQTAPGGQHAKFGQDQIGALGPVLNAIVLWTTTCIDAAVTQLRAESHELRDAGHRPALPAQAPRPEPPRPLQLHRLHPGRRRSTPAARPGRAGAG